MKELKFKVGEVYHAELTFNGNGGNDERVFAHQGWRVVGVTLDETLTKKRVRFEIDKFYCCPEPDFPVGKRITATVDETVFNGKVSEVCSRRARKGRHGFNVYADWLFRDFVKKDKEDAANDLLNGSVTKNGKEG